MGDVVSRAQEFWIIENYVLLCELIQFVLWISTSETDL